MRGGQRWSAPAVRSVWPPMLTPDSLRTQRPNNLSRWASSVPKPVRGRSNHVRSVQSRELIKRIRPQSLQHDQGLHEDQQIIIPDSLAETLRAHRKANKEAVLIRKRNTVGGNHVPVPPRQIENEALHLDLDRDEKQDYGKRPEYEGKSRGLSLDWDIIGDVARYLGDPWMRSLDDQGISRESAVERLSKEIRAADAFFTPTAKEVAAAKRAVKDIESFVTTGDEGIGLDLIGSRASGLAMPLSDLDLNLLLHERPERSNENASLEALRALHKRMRFGKLKNQHPAIQTIYFAAKARVPIIVGLHGPTGLEFQIQSASTGYGSLETARCMAAEYPTLTALFKVIKQMLKMRSLADGSQGGLTSYPLLIMIAVSLKQNAAQTDPYDVGSHLLHFLELYSKLDFYSTGITHAPSRHLGTSPKDATAASFFADEQTALSTIALVTQDPVGAVPMLFDPRHKLRLIHGRQDNFMMTLHDPANPYNDLGRSAYLIKHIQATFLNVYSELKECMSSWDRQIRAEGQAPAKPPSLLRPLVHGDYSMYNLERKRLISWLGEQKTISP
ncbi:hypothetical protein LTR70_001950 [Exophiala xenobiotica]|uniref:Poly(A) RNA polymerase mitochondrial-like central palm domain-containing protein n=1 Tax=Lithohypha guttulata TaxID=1690604 RepID=A0ABR0K994_9EURO|nr:hypothetical protein LTR24_005379 [Lithohypha guttulata]KAK5326935.1 hypothetical protein LTR70_001950 [Exophiala xenobiotica]